MVAIEQNGESEKTEKSGRSGALPWIGKGYYTTNVHLDNIEGRHVELCFDGAMAEPVVYVNGKRVGSWAYGYAPFKVALPYPWQRARPSALFRFLALAVLLYGHHLQVPFLVERPLDGPIVGHGDRLPVYAVARELPIFEISLNSPLCHRERWHEKGENAKDFFKHGQLLK